MDRFVEMNFAPLIPKIVLLKTASEKTGPSELTNHLHAFLDRAFQLKLDDDPIPELLELYVALNKENHLTYFNKHKQRKLTEEINVTILRLVRDNLRKQSAIKELALLNENKTPNKKNKKNIFLFSMLAITGVIFAAVEGASIMQMLISAFVSLQSVPALILIPVQILFAALTAGAFYVFEVTSVGKRLGIKGLQLGAIFKYYDLESQLFKEIFSLAGQSYSVCTDEIKFQKLNTYYDHIYESYNSFDNKITDARTAVRSSPVKDVTKKGLTLGAGAFCGIIAALGAQPILSTMIPLVIGASLAAGPIGLAVMVGLMAACGITTLLFFWLLEKKCDKVVDKVCGTPTKKLERLIKRDVKIKNQALQNTHYKEKAQDFLAQKKENQILRENLFKHLAAKDSEKLLTSNTDQQAKVDQTKKPIPTSSITHFKPRKNIDKDPSDKNEKLEQESSRAVITVENA